MQVIIGIAGLIGSGKDTVADHLINRHNFRRIKFADKLKDGVASIFEWPRHLLEGDTKESREWREIPDPFWTKELGMDITPRYVLQKFGTEVRDGFHVHTWTILLKKTILDNPNINYVIPDVRFPHEDTIIKELGGQMWKVSRGADPEWFTDYVEEDITPKHAHPSEWKWAKINFDWHVKNNNTVSELYQQVDKMISPFSDNMDPYIPEEEEEFGYWGT
jgi:hypothetical protein